MGTRHLIKVINNEGELKVAQYGQFDGYPSGMGIRTLFYATYHLNEIERGLKRVRWGTETEVDAIYDQYPQANYLGTEDCENLELLYPNLVRETSADILMVVAYSIGEVMLIDNSDFEEEGLFCEGVYTLNYQTKTFTSKYHGVELTIEFDKLPNHTEYLDLFNKQVEQHVKKLEMNAESNNNENEEEDNA